MDAILSKITLVGAVYLALISLLPIILFSGIKLRASRASASTLQSALPEFLSRRPRPAVRLRRHLDPDRGRRGDGHRPADRVAADHAALRQLHEEDAHPGPARLTMAGASEALPAQAPLRVVLLGPPGAGKGTQASLMARDHGLVKISTGDILREAVAHGTRLGRQIQSRIEAGNLVGDSTMVEIVQDRLALDDAKQGLRPRRLPADDAAGAGPRRDDRGRGRPPDDPADRGAVRGTGPPAAGAPRVRPLRAQRRPRPGGWHPLLALRRQLRDARRRLRRGRAAAPDGVPGGNGAARELLRRTRHLLPDQRHSWRRVPSPRKCAMPWRRRGRWPPRAAMRRQEAHRRDCLQVRRRAREDADGQPAGGAGARRPAPAGGAGRDDRRDRRGSRAARPRRRRRAGVQGVSRLSGDGVRLDQPRGRARHSGAARAARGRHPLARHGRQAGRLLRRLRRDAAGGADRRRRPSGSWS